MARWLVATFVMALLLLSASAASAKDFQPGDLRVCGVAGHCVPVVQQSLLNRISSFYYSAGKPPVAAAPPMGKPAYQLVFSDGYVSGIVVENRFLSYGVNLGRFSTSVWYRLPSSATSALHGLSRSLRPLRLSACAVRLSNSGPTLSTLPRCAR